jgi:hypothetical protein
MPERQDLYAATAHIVQVRKMDSELRQLQQWFETAQALVPRQPCANPQTPDSPKPFWSMNG